MIFYEPPETFFEFYWILMVIFGSKPYHRGSLAVTRWKGIVQVMLKFPNNAIRRTILGASFVCLKDQTHNHMNGGP